MANNKRQNKKVHPKKQRRTSNRRRMVKHTPSATRITPVDLLVKGARTLIGLLPGQTILKPISDFMFGETSVTTASSYELKSLLNNVKATNYVIGLQVRLDLSPTSALVDSSQLVLAKGGQSWYSNYQKCCMKHFVATAVPTCPSGKRSGMWAICLMPQDDLHLVTPTLTYREITETPFSKFGPATRTLTLEYTPTPRHPSCYGMIDIARTCLRMYIAFENPEDGTSYTSSDFGCNVQISGSVLLCCREDALHSYSREITYQSDQIYYTSDRVCIRQSSLDVNALKVLDSMALDEAP